MSNYLGDFALGQTIRFHFTTHTAAGALVAPSSAFAATDFRIYKDGSATERSSTAGVTVTSPFDSITGRHLIAIDTSNNTDAGFWSAGSDYRVEINSAKTIDGQVQSGVVIGTFSILNRSVNLGTNAPANWINAAAIAAAALDGKGNWNVGKTGYRLDATGNADVAAQVEAEVLNDATGGAVIATISNAVAAYFDNASTDIPPGIIAQAVWSYAPGRTLTANPGLDATSIRSALGLASANLDTQLSTIDGVADAVKLVTDKLATAIEDDGASGWQFTTLALANAPAGGEGGLDATGIRSALGLASANLDTQLSTIDGVVDAVKVVSDKLASAIEDDGASGWQFTVLALANAPTSLAEDDIEAIVTAVGNDLRSASSDLTGNRDFVERNEIRVIQRDDYSATDGRAYEKLIELDGVDFTSATVVAGAGQAAGEPTIVPTASLVNKTLGSCTLRIEFTSEQLDVEPGTYNWDAHIVLSTRRNTVITGQVIVEPKYADAPPE